MKMITSQARSESLENELFFFKKEKILFILSFDPSLDPLFFFGSLASTIFKFRPLILVPSNAIFAVLASSMLDMVTKANPLDLPVLRSLMILTDSTVP